MPLSLKTLTRFFQRSKDVSHLYTATPSVAWAFLDSHKVALDEGTFPRTANPFKIMVATESLLSDFTPNPRLFEVAKCNGDKILSRKLLLITG